MSRPSLHILPQPTAATCGPTCLHAVYHYFGDEFPLEQVIAEVAPLPSGGTLAVMLACHALRRGYEAAIYTYNLKIFDPTWFKGDHDLPALLAAQAQAKHDPKLRLATQSYLRFLELGGSIRHQELNVEMIEQLLADGKPVLTGLSATYLYGCARERDDDYDSVSGEPTGHFVLLSELDRGAETVSVADPLEDNPRFASRHYRVGIERLIGAILLGVVTYDANLLIIRPR